MPSINAMVLFLLAALFVSLTVSSPIALASSTDLATTTSTSAIEARDGVTNGFMYWQTTAWEESAKPIRFVGWTSNVCQNNPQSGDDWEAMYSDFVMPSPGSNARCWVYTEKDCKGQQSKEFNNNGALTYGIFGKGWKPHWSFKCTCDDKCITAI